MLQPRPSWELKKGLSLFPFLIASPGYFMDQFSHFNYLIPRHKLISDAPFIHLVYCGNIHYLFGLP